jgi:pimeloyl-ACP methyl ester carboxylesterase
LGWFGFLLASFFDAVLPVYRVFSLRVWGFSLRPRDVRQRLMKLKEAEVLKRLEHLPVLIVNGSGDTLAGLDEARWNFEAAKGPKELVVIESVSQESRRMEEAIGNHVFKGKEKETIDRTLLWLWGLGVS